MDIRSTIDSKSYMDLRSYLPPNGYIRRNIDSKCYMDLRGYFLLFPEASNGYIRRNIDSKSYMDLRSYFPLFSKKKTASKTIAKTRPRELIWTTLAPSVWVGRSVS